MHNITINLKTIARLSLITLIALSIARLGFVLALYDRVGSLSDAFFVLIQGIRVDIIVAGYFFPYSSHNQYLVKTR